jgi:integrase
LSNDRAEALRLWAKQEGVREDDSTKLFSVVARRYVREVFPTKAIRTQVDNEAELKNLVAVFGGMPIDAIMPMHVRQYLDIRGETAKTRANREKALFSHVYNKAREWGYTDLQNPCLGVKGFKETGRSRYVTDDEFLKVRAHAHFTVVDAMDLALLTGQRPSDVLKLKHSDIRDGALWIVQNKTSARLGIEVTGELAQVIERMQKYPRKQSGQYIVQDEKGQRVTQTALRSRFTKAREIAGIDFQFRDLRAKAATDTGDLAHSQKLLAHKKRDMTEHYVKARMGDRVKPLR